MISYTQLVYTLTSFAMVSLITSNTSSKACPIGVGTLVYVTTVSTGFVTVNSIRSYLTICKSFAFWIKSRKKSWLTFILWMIYIFFFYDSECCFCICSFLLFCLFIYCFISFCVCLFFCLAAFFSFSFLL